MKKLTKGITNITNRTFFYIKKIMKNYVLFFTIYAIILFIGVSFVNISAAFDLVLLLFYFSSTFIIYFLIFYDMKYSNINEEFSIRDNKEITQYISIYISILVFNLLFLFFIIPFTFFAQFLGENGFIFRYDSDLAYRVNFIETRFLIIIYLVILISSIAFAFSFLIQNITNNRKSFFIICILYFILLVIFSGLGYVTYLTNNSIDEYLVFTPIKITFYSSISVVFFPGIHILSFASKSLLYDSINYLTFISNSNINLAYIINLAIPYLFIIIFATLGIFCKTLQSN